MANKKTTKKRTTKTKGEKIGAALGKEIEKEFKECCKEHKNHSCKTKKSDCGTGSCFYGLGVIGAAVYYLTTATGFWNGVWGFIKALAWPAFLVHGLLKFIGL